MLSSHFEGAIGESAVLDAASGSQHVVRSHRGQVAEDDDIRVQVPAAVLKQQSQPEMRSPLLKFKERVKKREIRRLHTRPLLEQELGLKWI